MAKIDTSIELLTDRDVPQIPPHIELGQVDGLTGALLHGDPTAREW